MPDEVATLRAQQVDETRRALITAARALFGSKGYAATPVDEVAAAARVTTGALYHHFKTKAALFEAVFVQVHAELMLACIEAAAGATGIDELLRGFDAFLTEMTRDEALQIVVRDGPAVLGLARFTELDEDIAFSAVVAALQLAEPPVEEAETVARLLLGLLTRAGMLIAGAPDREVAREQAARAVRTVVKGLVADGAGAVRRD